MTKMAGPDCAVMCNLINNMLTQRKKRRQEREGWLVAADPDNLENTQEAGGEAQGCPGHKQALYK